MSRSFRSLVVTTSLVFAILFTIAAGGQYWFLRWQLDQEIVSGLKDHAEKVCKSIAFEDHWNLQGYRRSGGPDDYLLMAQNGTVIDAEGDYIREMNLHVSLPFALEYDHPISFLSDVGEDWNMYVHKLSDGIVVIGVRKDETPEGISERFASSAAQFGASVDEAMRTSDRKIDEAFDFAIIDNNQILLRAYGGIPLKISSIAMSASMTFARVHLDKGETQDVFLEPVKSKSGSVVGFISDFQDVTWAERVLRKSAAFNAIIAVLLWVITVAFFTVYQRRVRPSTISCDQIPCLDEDETVEFKSSLRWDYINQKSSKEVERAIVKAIVGFMNSEKGGTLIIGISDSKEVLGLQADYASFKSQKSDRDIFELTLRQILITAVGERGCARWVKTRFCSLQGKEVCVVTVAPSSDPVFLEEEGTGKLFVRVGNSTRPFGAKEALAYARDRWGGFALPRLRFRRPIPNPAG
jgi:hypothetical protein